jgi:copper homeostasis protein
LHSIVRHRQYRRNIPNTDKVGTPDVIIALKSLTEVHHSGQKAKVQEGVPILEGLFKTRKELVEDDAWGLTIMPGSGINSKSVSSILPSLLPLGLREIHLSGGKWTPGGMAFHRDGMGMGCGDDGEWGVWRTQESEVRKVREMADDAWKEYIKQTD